MATFSEHFKSLLGLAEHIDTSAASTEIRSNVQFKGPNVFILACAIIIASVGLNVNSIPVIIGAMLISPVMGPILGFGLSLGIQDKELMTSSIKNYIVMVAISIISATIYFLISPLALDNPSELLARTRPTIYDVAIAFFGGIAAMFELSRKKHGTVLSGAAIATALMPPLCTVGYGIATWKSEFFLGATYLFIINTVFIALAAFLVSKYLGYKVVAHDDTAHSRIRTSTVVILLTIMIVPSVITAIDVINENKFTTDTERFVSAHKTIGSSYIYDHKIVTNDGKKVLVVYIAGESLGAAEKQLLIENASRYGLAPEQIQLNLDAAVSSDVSESEVVRNLYEYYDRRVQDLNQTILELKLELAKYKDQ